MEFWSAAHVQKKLADSMHAPVFDSSSLAREDLFEGISFVSVIWMTVTKTFDDFEVFLEESLEP